MTKLALYENKKIQKEIETFVGSVTVEDMFVIYNEEDGDTKEKVEVENIWFSRFIDYLFKKNFDTEVEKMKKIIELNKENEEF